MRFRYLWPVAIVALGTVGIGFAGFVLAESYSSGAGDAGLVLVGLIQDAVGFSILGWPLLKHIELDDRPQVGWAIWTSASDRPTGRIGIAFVLGGFMLQAIGVII